MEGHRPAAPQPSVLPVAELAADMAAADTAAADTAAAGMQAADMAADMAAAVRESGSRPAAVPVPQVFCQEAEECQLRFQ